MPPLPEGLGAGYVAANKALNALIGGTRPTGAQPTPADALVQRMTGKAPEWQQQGETPAEQFLYGLMRTTTGFTTPENLALMYAFGPLGAVAQRVKEGAGIARMIAPKLRPLVAKAVRHAPLAGFAPGIVGQTVAEARGGNPWGAAGSLAALVGVPLAV